LQTKRTKLLSKSVICGAQLAHISFLTNLAFEFGGIAAVFGVDHRPFCDALGDSHVPVRSGASTMSGPLKAMTGSATAEDVRAEEILPEPRPFRR
jgi:hypothetical protein